jgi:hypothetical protein
MANSNSNNSFYSSGHIAPTDSRDVVGESKQKSVLAKVGFWLRLSALVCTCLLGVMLIAISTISNSNRDWSNIYSKITTKQYSTNGK